MSKQKAQPFWAPSGATVRLPPRMRLAPAERERLWKGLERFVNCGDSVDEFGALGRGFLEFWPVDVWHYPNQEGLASSPLQVLGTIRAASKGELSEAEIKQMERESQTEILAWHPVCHKLFLFYRDTLREVWRGERLASRIVDRHPTHVAPRGSAALSDLFPTPLGWFGGNADDFLLGLTDYNEEALDKAKNRGFDLGLVRPFVLDRAWGEILNQFPTAASEGRVEITMLWEQGDFSFVPHNDFQRAFYLLFRENWRARVCPRCKMFFIARKPKQVFCGTGCSAGSRLDSKRKWWNNVGAKRRARQSQKPERSRTERKSR